MEWDLKRVSNLIQMINDYYIENKHDKHTTCFNIKSEHYRWKDINYTEKPITERLSQTTNNFSNI